jgi:uncharacterized membrane protein YhfC
MQLPVLWRFASYLAMVAVGALPVALWRRRHRLSWRPAALGALAFVLQVAAALVYAAERKGPGPTGFKRLLMPGGDSLDPVPAALLQGALFAVIVGGIVRASRLRRAEWPDAVLFGLGLGGAEAAFLGGLALLLNAGLLVAPQFFPAELQAVFQTRAEHFRGVTAVVGPVVERAAAVAMELLSVLLVLAGFRRRRAWAGLGLGVAYQCGLVLLLGWAVKLLDAHNPRVPISSLGLIEVAIAALGIACVPAIAWARRAGWGGEAVAAPAPVPAGEAVSAACADHEIAIEQHLHGALPQGALPPLEAHLAVCAGCRAYRDAAASSDGGIGALGALAGRATDWEAVESRIRRRAAFPVRALSAGLGAAALLVPALTWLSAPPGERRLVAISLALLSGGGLLAAAVAAARRVRRFARLQGPEELLAYHKRRLRARILWLERWPWAALALVLFQLADFASWGGPTGSLRIALALLVLLAAAVWAQGVVVRLPRYRRELAELEPGSPGAP